MENMKLERLQSTVKRAYENVPHYRKAMDSIGVKPDHIKSLDDVKLLPFTTKDDLRSNYPYGMFAVPMNDVVRIHASSGTTGKPTVVGYTQKDIDTWGEVVARALVNVGTTSDDIVHVAFGYGLFTGGLGLHYGAEKLGASVVPMSGGNTRRQVTLLQDFKATILTCTPSYALHLAETAQDIGIDPASLSLRIGVFGAEPWSEGIRTEIEQKFDIQAYDIYGLSEVIGPGVACECTAKHGLHIMDDNFLPEIIDPVTGETLPPGETGELVLTSLTKEAMPVLRYRTRDITSIIPEKCVCGSTHLRIQRIAGRTDDMLIIRGVNVFPSQIETVISSIPQLVPHYLLVVDKKGPLANLEVWVEASLEAANQPKYHRELARRTEKEIFGVLGLHIPVKVVPPKTLKRSEGKAVRVADVQRLKESLVEGYQIS
jgi:phenylacetate-CoA ligase